MDFDRDSHFDHSIDLDHDMDFDPGIEPRPQTPQQTPPQSQPNPNPNPQSRWMPSCNLWIILLAICIMISCAAITLFGAMGAVWYFRRTQKGKITSSNSDYIDAVDAHSSPTKRRSSSKPNGKRGQRHGGRGTGGKPIKGGQGAAQHRGDQSSGGGQGGVLGGDQRGSDDPSHHVVGGDDPSGRGGGGGGSSGGGGGGGGNSGGGRGSGGNSGGGGGGGGNSGGGKGSGGNSGGGGGGGGNSGGGGGSKGVQSSDARGGGGDIRGDRRKKGDQPRDVRGGEGPIPRAGDTGDPKPRDDGRGKSNSGGDGGGVPNPRGAMILMRDGLLFQNLEVDGDFVHGAIAMEHPFDGRQMTVQVSWKFVGDFSYATKFFSDRGYLFDDQAVVIEKFEVVAVEQYYTDTPGRKPEAPYPVCQPADEGFRVYPTSGQWQQLTPSFRGVPLMPQCAMLLMQDDMKLFNNLRHDVDLVRGSIVTNHPSSGKPMTVVIFWRRSQEQDFVEGMRFVKKAGYSFGKQRMVIETFEVVKIEQYYTNTGNREEVTDYAEYKTGAKGFRFYPTSREWNPIPTRG